MGERLFLYLVAIIIDKVIGNEFFLENTFLLHIYISTVDLFVYLYIYNILSAK